MSAIIQCKNCNANIDVPDGYVKVFIKCPSCQKMTPVNLPARSSTGISSSSVAKTPSVAQSSPQKIQSASSISTTSSPLSADSIGGGDLLPEIMKANKRIAGQACQVCKKPIQLGDDVHNCPSCHRPNHQACWNRNNGCGLCASGTIVSKQPYSAKSEMATGVSSAPLPSSSAGDMVPCRWCKEPIVRGARKCKHCGEFQRDEDRQIYGAKDPLLADDPPLSATDWIGVLCCPLIAIIQGVYWASTGNPKGLKIIKYSVISMIVTSLLRGLLGALGG